MTKLSEFVTIADEQLLARGEHDQALCTEIDEFFSTTCALQAKRVELTQVSAAKRAALVAQSRMVFALYMRLAALLQQHKKNDVVEATELFEGVFNLARLVPFSQLFGQHNRAGVSQLLDQLVAKFPAFAPRIGGLQIIYVKYLERIHLEAEREQRARAKELLLSIYEMTMSLNGMLCSKALQPVLLLNNIPEEEALTSTQSMLRALVTCYEADLPVLQRTAARTVEHALLVAETRRNILTIMGTYLDSLMTHKRGDLEGEKLLSTLHSLSHCCTHEKAEQGSLLSDLWSIFKFQEKCTKFFSAQGMDSSQTDYLQTVIDALPQRKLVAPVTTPAAKPAAKTNTKKKGAAHDKQPTVSEDTVVMQSMIQQVQDLFPDLGNGFIELCLVHSNMKLEVVINYLLEGNVPSVLANVNRDLKRSDKEFNGALQKLTQPAAATKKTPSAAPATTKTAKSPEKKLDPQRVWIGKKAQEKTYDPRVNQKDPKLAEKMKQLVESYDHPEEFALDEYDDDYNDEFEDYEPFSVTGGGQSDDFDAVREHNRRMRAKEEEDAFWESMRNPNRKAVDDEDDDEAEGADDHEEKPRAHPARSTPTPAQKGPQKKTADKTSGASGTTPELTPQQVQRARARNNKNKAKAGNHNRKDRALKKQAA